MFGTQIDDPVTMTTPLKADPVVTGAKIHGLQIDPIIWVNLIGSVLICAWLGHSFTISRATPS